ncbi:trypsin-like peptidase domain-containing protein [Aeromicrobium sp.]|nr:trypsin-like peptidase domain-containing protein [Candidatus Saccharibacteria bacterium]
MPELNKKNELSSTDEQSYSVSSNGQTSRRPVRNTTADAWNIRIPKVRAPKPPKFRVSRRRLGALGLLLALLLGAATGFAGGYYGASVRADNGTIGTSMSAQRKMVNSQSQLISQIAKSVGPSVVSVDVVGQTNDGGLNSIFGDGGGQQASAGTGIIISKQGLIITNRHVVPVGTTNVSVTLSDGTELDNVQVIGRTTESDTLDIAFLKIGDAKGHKLTPAAIGDSSQLQVGDAVVAIGNALGQFQNTVTSGIISGYGRSVQAGDGSGSQGESLDDLFQTDAAINEGNSGGPLVNLNGQVIGINTAIAAGDAQNIGFAIPVNDVTGLIKQIQKTGKLERPYLGVRYVALTPDVAAQYKLDVTNGAFIPPAVDSASPSILPGSPAEKAGLQPGDVITSIADTKIDQTHSLTSIINKHQVGDRVNLKVLRDGKTIDASATLAVIPAN